MIELYGVKGLKLLEPGCDHICPPAEDAEKSFTLYSHPLTMFGWMQLLSLVAVAACEWRRLYEKLESTAADGWVEAKFQAEQWQEAYVRCMEAKGF